MEKISNRLFWNLCFVVISGFIDKVIHSLGSDKLTDIVSYVCEHEDTPATFLIEHGIFMWYNKSLQIPKVAERFADKDFSKTAQRIMKFMVSRHCSIHKISYKDKQG